MSITKWEYKSIRFDYLGRGITQEFNILDIDGERMKGWFSLHGEKMSNLPDMLNVMGQNGWELITHSVNQFAGHNVDSSVTWHYMTFKRPAEIETKEHLYEGVSNTANHKGSSGFGINGGDDILSF